MRPLDESKPVFCFEPFTMRLVDWESHLNMPQLLVQLATIIE
jgi:hypothetical protein